MSHTHILSKFVSPEMLDEEIEHQKQVIDKLKAKPNVEQYPIYDISDSVPPGFPALGLLPDAKQYLKKEEIKLKVLEMQKKAEEMSEEDLLDMAISDIKGHVRDHLAVFQKKKDVAELREEAISDYRRFLGINPSCPRLPDKLALTQNCTIVPGMTRDWLMCQIPSYRVEYASLLNLMQLQQLLEKKRDEFSVLNTTVITNPDYDKDKDDNVVDSP